MFGDTYGRVDMPELHATSLVHRLGRSFGIVLAALLVLTAVPGYSPKPLQNTASAAESIAQLPLSFVPNAGQTNPAVRFMVHSPAGHFFFTPATVVLALPAPRLPDPPDPANPVSIPERPDPPSALRLRFLDARPGTMLTGARQLPGVANYLIGDDPAQWRSRLPTYAAIVYEQLYDGIDLRYEGGEGRLKSTYLVAAGADPGRIRWRYEGATRVQIDSASGDLVITVPIAPEAGGGQHVLRERAPVAWQMVDGQQVTVAASYAVAQDGSIGFAIGGFDAGRPLVIDPTLAYSTYLGGSDIDQGLSLAIDPGHSGSIYVTGITRSSNFPTATPWQGSLGGSDDAFVAKLSAKLDTLSYSTYLGGSSLDWGYGIATDDDGTAYVVGTTFAGGLLPNPLYTFQGGSRDGFVIKLSDAGSPVYSTYLGGSANDRCFGVAVDSDHAAYVVGETTSLNFPVANPLQSANAGAVDAFVTKLNPAGTGLSFSTYLGGSSYDNGLGIALDFAGNIYVTGRTDSTDFPLADALQGTVAGQDDAFVARLTPGGNTLAYSSYLGGSGVDISPGVAVDGACNAAITGATLSQDYPISPNAVQPKPGGSYDAFVSKISGDVDIWVDTSAISVTLQPGESITVPITIGNDGDETLCYSITKEEVSYPAQSATIEFPPTKVDPALEDALEEAPNGMADFLVYLTTQADLSAAYQIEDWSARGWYVYDTLRDTVANTQGGVLADLADLIEVGHVTAFESHFSVNAVSVTGDEDAVDSLAERSDVAFIEHESNPAPPQPPEEPGSAPEAGSSWDGIPWGIKNIRADLVWNEFGYDGEGVVVANIDTGVDYDHPALLHQYRGYDPNTGTVDHDYNWYDGANPANPVPDYDGDHGTHVMGVMVGFTPAGVYTTSTSVYTGPIHTGVVPNADWISVRHYSNVITEFDWFLAPCRAGYSPGDAGCNADPDKRPHIINSSWPHPGAGVLNSLRAAGILTVYSAGNEGASTPLEDGFCTLPTGGGEAIGPSFSVGAIGMFQQITPTVSGWSSRGPGHLGTPPIVRTNELKPDVVAPGVQILSTVPPDIDPDGYDDGYTSSAGTSQAAPHVAGAAALLRQALEENNNTTGDVVSRLECLLTSSASDVIRVRWPEHDANYCLLGTDYASGYGLINVYEAVGNITSGGFPLWISLANNSSGSTSVLSGIVAPGEAQTAFIYLNAVCPESGTFDARLRIASNDPGQSPIEIPIRMNVPSSPLPTCESQPPPGTVVVPLNSTCPE